MAMGHAGLVWAHTNSNSSEAGSSHERQNKLNKLFEGSRNTNGLEGFFLLRGEGLIKLRLASNSLYWDEQV